MRVERSGGWSAEGLEARSRVPRALVQLGLRWPRGVLGAWGLLAVLASSGVARLEIETSTDSVIDRRHPAWSFYQGSQELFGGDEIVAIVFEDDEPYGRKGLTEVARLTAALEALAGVRRVDSLATVPLVEATADGALSLDPALAEELPRSRAASTALARRVGSDRIAPRNLVSDDGRSYAVNLILEQGAEARYDEILDQVRRALEGRRAWVSGVPVFRTETDARTRSELLLFVPLTVLAVGALLYAGFASWPAVAIPLLASGLGTWLVLGTMGALCVPITISTVLLPSILLALGCAYNMHLLTAVAGREGPAAVREGLLRVALPVALSGLTTAVGFLAVSLVRIDTIRHVGAFGALGVFAVLLATLTAAPAALWLFPLPEPRLRLTRWLRASIAPRLVEVAASRRRALLAGWLAVLALVSIGIARVHVETDVIVWFSEDDPIRASYDAIRSRMSGISPMNVVIEAPEGKSASTARAVAAIDGLARHLEALREVGRAISVADPLRQIHGGFIDDPSQPLPPSSNLIAQYLLLLEGEDYMREVLTSDRSAANVRLRVDDNGSDALLAVARAAQAWWQENGVPGYQAQTTGIMYEFARSEDAIAWGQIQGLAFALAVIGAILLAIFGSPRLAGIALLPNAIPIAMAFGAMGLLGISLDAGTVVLGNLALGIAVDDTLHVVTGFHQRRGGPEASLRGAFEHALPALVLTTLAVATGFAILGLSSFTLTRHLGLLTAGIMALCLLADLLLLPPLLLGLRRRVREPAADALPEGAGH